MTGLSDSYDDHFVFFVVGSRHCELKDQVRKKSSFQIQMDCRCVVMNEKSSLLFFIFWTALLMGLSYDYFKPTDPPVEGIVLDVIYEASGKIVKSNIVVRTGQGVQVFRLDPVSIRSVANDDAIRIVQSRIFKRTVSISGPDYHHNSRLAFWNLLFLLVMAVSAIASLGSAFIYLRYLL